MKKHRRRRQAKQTRTKSKYLIESTNLKVFVRANADRPHHTVHHRVKRSRRGGLLLLLRREGVVEDGQADVLVDWPYPAALAARSDGAPKVREDIRDSLRGGGYAKGRKSKIGGKGEGGGRRGGRRVRETHSKVNRTCSAGSQQRGTADQQMPKSTSVHLTCTQTTTTTGKTPSECGRVYVQHRRDRRSIPNAKLTGSRQGRRAKPKKKRLPNQLPYVHSPVECNSSSTSDRQLVFNSTM